MRGTARLPAEPGNTNKSLSMQSSPSGSTQFVRVILRGHRLEGTITHDRLSPEGNEILRWEQLDDNRKCQPQVGQRKP